VRTRRFAGLAVRLALVGALQPGFHLGRGLPLAFAGIAVVDPALPQHGGDELGDAHLLPDDLLDQFLVVGREAVHFSDQVGLAARVFRVVGRSGAFDGFPVQGPGRYESVDDGHGAYFLLVVTLGGEEVGDGLRADLVADTGVGLGPPGQPLVDQGDGGLVQALDAAAGEVVGVVVDHLGGGVNVVRAGGEERQDRVLVRGQALSGPGAG
jgi:hypothetical protein